MKHAGLAAVVRPNEEIDVSELEGGVFELPESLKP